MKKIVILGAGTGGTIMANLLTRKLDPKEWEITIIDKSDRHLYQPGLLFLPFKLYGYSGEKDIARPIRGPLPSGAKFVQATINMIDHKKRVVQTSSGNYDYDWLVLSLGCRIVPEETPGLNEVVKSQSGGVFYTLEGALDLQKKLDSFKEGRLVLNVADVPIKCPVAPIEFVFLADYYFHKKGIRDRVEISFVTPYGGAFTKPYANKVLTRFVEEKGIKIVPNFQLDSVDPKSKTLVSAKGEKVQFDMLASIPLNYGPQVVEDSGLSDGTGFALTEKNRLKALKADHIFVIGDNTNVPTSKAGSVAHFEAEVVCENLLREIEGKEALPDFDGHSNCFIESGFNKAFLIDFNYDIQPLAGKFPIPGVGPFSLLKETRTNHMGKMAFRWAYWNMLLPGKLPGDPLLPGKMSLRGKDQGPLKEG
jgi:sulfide:quinone oxidoreductase